MPEPSNSPKYMIEVGSTVDELEAKVNNALARGWFPSGSMVTHYDPHVNRYYFHQPLIKTEHAI